MSYKKYSMKEVPSVCNPKTFEEIYRSHSKTLYNFMYYKCGDVAKAEDFVQESYVRLWTNCAKVVFSSVKSYLFTIAKNLFLKDLEHQKVVLKHQKDQGAQLTNETPEFLLEAEEFRQRLRSAISDLPTAQREVFLLNRIDKKKYREIAEMLNVSIKTVEKRMALALGFLTERLGKKYKI